MPQLNNVPEGRSTYGARPGRPCQCQLHNKSSNNPNSDNSHRRQHQPDERTSKPESAVELLRREFGSGHGFFSPSRDQNALAKPSAIAKPIATLSVSSPSSPLTQRRADDEEDINSHIRKYTQQLESLYFPPPASLDSVASVQDTASNALSDSIVDVGKLSIPSNSNITADDYVEVQYPDHTPVFSASAILERPTMPASARRGRGRDNWALPAAGEDDEGEEEDDKLDCVFLPNANRVRFQYNALMEADSLENSVSEWSVVGGDDLE